MHFLWNKYFFPGFDKLQHTRNSFQIDKIKKFYYIILHFLENKNYWFAYNKSSNNPPLVKKLLRFFFKKFQMLTSEFLKDSSAARGTQDYTFGQGRGTALIDWSWGLYILIYWLALLAGFLQNALQKYITEIYLF